MPAAAGPEAGGDAPAAKRLKEDKPAPPDGDVAAAPDGDGSAAAAGSAAAIADAAPGAADPAEPAATAAAEAAPAVDDETMLFGAADEDEKDEAPDDGAGPKAPDTDGGGGGEEAPVAAAADTKKEEDKPVTLGYKTFAGGKECFDYFHKLLSKLTPDQDLNEVYKLPTANFLKCHGFRFAEFNSYFVSYGCALLLDDACLACLYGKKQHAICACQKCGVFLLRLIEGPASHARGDVGLDQGAAPCQTLFIHLSVLLDVGGLSADDAVLAAICSMSLR